MGIGLGQEYDEEYDSSLFVWMCYFTKDIDQVAVGAIIHEEFKNVVSYLFKDQRHMVVDMHANNTRKILSLLRPLGIQFMTHVLRAEYF